MDHVQTDNGGSPGTWEILSFPRQHPGRRYRVTNSRPRRRTCPPRSEHNECNRGTAKRRKRSAAGRAAGSRSALIVLLKQGNSPWRTLWREAKRRPADPVEGNMPSTSRLDHMSPSLDRISPAREAGAVHKTERRTRKSTGNVSEGTRSGRPQMRRRRRRHVYRC